MKPTAVIRRQYDEKIHVDYEKNDLIKNYVNDMSLKSTTVI